MLQGELGMPELQVVKTLQDEVATLMEHQDLKWRQLTKERWPRQGDQNTGYFMHV